MGWGLFSSVLQKMGWLVVKQASDAVSGINPFDTASDVALRLHAVCAYLSDE